MEAIATAHGTPVYVYNAATIAQQVNRLREAFIGMRSRILYACKALPNQSILRLMRRLGTGLDAVSIDISPVQIM